MKKIFVLGFEIDLDNLSKKTMLSNMCSEERRAVYEKEENPGGEYELNEWFNALNNDFIDTENYIWLPVEQ